MAEQNEFLNARSMLTPGIAGSVVMLITNTLWDTFSLSPRWTALALSLMVGCLVFLDQSLPRWQRAFLYVLNSLIIFSVSIGTNYGAIAIRDMSKPVHAAIEPHRFFDPWL